jgi:hypothetical protein
MRKSYEPSPQDISQACRDIQRGWSVSGELKRRGAVDQVWPSLAAGPVVAVPDVVPAQKSFLLKGA